MAGELTWISGKLGYVRQRISTDDDSEQWEWTPVQDWSFAMHADFVKRNVMRLDVVEGYQDGVSGFKSARFTCKGPWAEEQSPLTVGHVYDFVGGITEDGPMEYEGTFHLTDLTPSNTAEDGPMMDVSGDSVGPFDITSLGSEGELT